MEGIQIMARPNRVKLSGEGYYHVTDRIAHKEFLLRDERIKRRLLDLLYRARARKWIRSAIQKSLKAVSP